MSKNKKIEKLVIQFDSSSALLKSLALCLADQDFKGAGIAPNIPSWVGNLVNVAPRKARTKMYSWSGWIDALQAEDLQKLDTAEIADWAAELYPQRSYNGVMFGSSNGAAIHLAAALGMPWLPQTYLVAVRRFLKPGQIHKDIAWGREVITPVLKKLPDLHAAQMHDPVQDRLMVAKMGYFRLKLLNLPVPFEKFLQKHTSPRKPFISVECNYPWPVLDVGKRHTFQLGGFGDIDPYEYLNGSDRTRAFLKKVKSKTSHWDSFKPTREIPEAEWGFHEQCLQELKTAARKNKAPFYRLIFAHPEGLSAFACDLYRWWYQKRLGFVSKRMIIENFGLIAPHRALVSGTLPFWLAFNTRNSADHLENYLQKHPEFNDLYLMLMSNGVTHGIGLTTIKQWQAILKHAKREGRLIGVDKREYPLDFGTFMRYHNDLKEALPDQYPKPKPLTIAELKEFLADHPGRYPLTLREQKV